MFEYSDAPKGGYKYAALVYAPGSDTIVTIGATEITAHLALMYDLLMGSMDMGSGFLDAEDIERIGEIGRLCGFESLPQCPYVYRGGTYQPGKVWYDPTCQLPVGHPPGHQVRSPDWAPIGGGWQKS